MDVGKKRKTGTAEQIHPKSERTGYCDSLANARGKAEDRC